MSPGILLDCKYMGLTINLLNQKFRSGRGSSQFSKVSTWFWYTLMFENHCFNTFLPNLFTSHEKHRKWMVSILYPHVKKMKLLGNLKVTSAPALFSSMAWAAHYPSYRPTQKTLDLEKLHQCKRKYRWMITVASSVIIFENQGHLDTYQQRNGETMAYLCTVNVLVYSYATNHWVV